MYKHIVMGVALDHEHDMKDALEIAQKLLVKGGKVTALHVLEDLPSYATQYVPPDYLNEFHKEIAVELHHMIRDAPNTHLAVVVGHPGRSIVAFAAEHEADCIIIASHRPGLEDYFLGSTASRVVRHAKCSVHVIR